MKTTVDLPDDLMIAAKKRAAETRSTLRRLLERGLRRELAEARPSPQRGRPRRLKWITVDGGLPAGLDLTDRSAMHEWLRHHRT